VALGGAWRGGGVYCGVPDVPNCEVLGYADLRDAGCAGLSGCADLAGIKENPGPRWPGIFLSGTPD